MVWLLLQDRSKRSADDGNLRQGLIAINYPARKSGLTRHITITEAKKLCPELIMQHVATWKEGDEKWAYHDDAFQNIATHKVSLDPYRLESRRILACIKETLPADLQKVEKASVDEVFMDLSAQVHSIMLERYAELAGPAPYDDPTENLPLPPTTVLDWQADALVDLDVDETEEDDPDWDDIAILIGSEIVRSVRAAVFAKLKYTISGGIAQNKMLSKLGSAHKKPNAQTIIRNRAVQQFMSEFKFTKIRGLGGKLGEQITSAFNTDTVKELLPISVEQLKSKLGADTGTWVYQIIRGNDSSEVNSRTQIKSMLSAKSFRPSINTVEQAHRWLRIFAADIHSRLVEEGVLENKRRPKTMTLHHRQGGQTKSRQAAIPSGKKVEEAGLFELAKTLLGQSILEGRVWPCDNLSLAVGGFEDGISGNMGIGAFLVKNSPKTPEFSVREAKAPESSEDRPEKRRRLEAPSGIDRFFVKSESTEEHDDDFGSQQTVVDSRLKEEKNAAVENVRSDELAETGAIESHSSVGALSLHQKSISDFLCVRCNQALTSAEALQSHQDWHMAKDLQDEDRGRVQPKPATAVAPNKKPTAKPVKKSTARAKPEKGQSKLAFG